MKLNIKKADIYKFFIYLYIMILVFIVLYYIYNTKSTSTIKNTIAEKFDTDEIPTNDDILKTIKTFNNINTGSSKSVNDFNKSIKNKIINNVINRLEDNLDFYISQV